jgi:aspartate beta-hydroxylase
MNESNGAMEFKNDEMDAFLHNSLVLANRLLFCAFCEMDGSQVESGRQKLVQCISITMALFFTYPLTSSRDTIRGIMNDAWMELMLRLVVLLFTFICHDAYYSPAFYVSIPVYCCSMEESPQHRIVARHVAALAIGTKSFMWSDPYQRPGYMARVGLSGIPYTPPENHPPWCCIFESNWIRILNEYIGLNSTPSNFSNVGSGQRGSGHDDHLVVSGRGWKEYVLFGTGSKDNDSDAPFTKELLRSTIPDAVALAEDGGGEVIFSCLSPRTHIEPHCGPTNLRWTAHLGLVIPDSASDCRIRVRDDWHSWQAGKIFLFDDSYEHEVRNDTDDARVVLLIRLWHPKLAQMAKFQRESILSEAMAEKEEQVRKRYHPPS